MPDRETIRLLFLGDIVGRPGRRAVCALLPKVKEEFGVDVVIANGENAAGGLGITPQIAGKLFSYGVDCLTSGNHLWVRREIEEYLQECNRLLRPANYPPDVPGRGWTLLKTPKGEVGVVCLLGRVFLSTVDCPFRVLDSILEEIKEFTNVVIVDFHAEATAEKKAFGFYTAGRLSAVVGTHTHVATTDAQILQGGTGYITDVGMCGVFDSVIGMNKEVSIKRFLMQMPLRYECAKDGDVRINAVVIDIDCNTGRALGIEWIERRLEDGGVSEGWDNTGEGTGEADKGKDSQGC